MLSHIDRKLMREIESKPGMPVWREDEDGQILGYSNATCCSRLWSSSAVSPDTGRPSRWSVVFLPAAAEAFIEQPQSFPRLGGHDVFGATDNNRKPVFHFSRRPQEA